MTSTESIPQCKYLVIDTGPLLSLSPLRGLAETYLTAPLILAELKDKQAREHFERLGLSAGVKVEIRSPDAASLAHVIQFSKKTGDYSVLSHADLCVLALTYTLHQQGKQDEKKKGVEPVKDETSAPIVAENVVIEEGKDASSVEDISSTLESTTIEESTEASEPHTQLEDSQISEVPNASDVNDEIGLEPLDVELVHEGDGSNPSPEDPPPPPQSNSPEAEEESSRMLYDDPSDDDDGEGEWITPTNVGLHKSRALHLLPTAGSGRGRKDKVVYAGCMTADFAMQNVLLQMDLNLVGVEGKRIEKVKSWVLRCHACYKICKDSSKKFCPSCGNPSLLRASVTIASPKASADAPAMQVHLKKNFQFKTRGTKYPIPAPKPGSAKGGAGTGLILREDQTEYMRAQKMADGKREREEAKMRKGVFARGKEGDMGSGGVGSWMDPDWVPEILSAGTGGKGRSVRSSGMDGDMPVIGYGRKNPNERKKRK